MLGPGDKGGKKSSLPQRLNILYFNNVQIFLEYNNNPLIYIVGIHCQESRLGPRAYKLGLITNTPVLHALLPQHMGVTGR